MFEVELFEVVNDVAEYFRDIDLEAKPQVDDIIDGVLRVTTLLEPEEDGADYRIVVEYIWAHTTPRNGLAHRNGPHDT